MLTSSSVRNLVKEKWQLIEWYALLTCLSHIHAMRIFIKFSRCRGMMRGKFNKIILLSENNSKVSIEDKKYYVIV